MDRNEMEKSVSERSTFRKQLKQEDELVETTENVVVYLKEHQSQAILAAVALVVALGGVWGVGQYRDYRRSTAARAFGEAYTSYAAARDDKSKIPEAIRKQEQVYAEYPKQAGGQDALFNAGNLAWLNGDYRAALDKYRLLLDKHGDNALLKPLALRGVAAVLEQIGDMPGATSILDQVLAAEQGQNKARAHLDLARLHARSGNAEKAKAEYQTVVDSFADSPWADEARDRLGLPPAKKVK
jgi:TolA-binding protein